MLVNGISTIQIDALDRSIAYGDGLFSTIKIEKGELLRRDLHLRRFKVGAGVLFFPDVDWDLLEAEASMLALTVRDEKQAVLKVILSRGSGGRGYSAQGCNNVTRLLSLHDFPTHYLKWKTEGIDVIACDYQLSINKITAGLKTLNRLDQILIKREIESKNAIDGIVCDQEGLVIEACAANLFIYKNEQWFTPDLKSAGVKGVMRASILEKAKANQLSIKEQSLTP